MRIITILLAGLIGVTLNGCDTKSTEQIRSKTDAITEALDQKIDSLANQSNILQPIAKTTDNQLQAVHNTLIHPATNSSTQQESASK